MNLKITLLLAMILEFWIPSLVMASEENSNFGNCRILDDCRLEFTHLSSQKTDPFLFSGRAMDSCHPRWHQYRRAMRRFPDVRNCLTEAKQDEVEPNLLLFDWQRVGTGRGAEVCVFRIARSLRDLGQIKLWLEFHEFRVGNLSWRYSESYRPRYDTQPVSHITGYWTKERYRQVNSSWIASLTGIDLILNYQLSVRFTQENVVVGVHAETPSK